MATIYEAVKELKQGDEKGKPVGKFRTSEEAQTECDRLAAEDKTGKYNYFVAVISTP